MGDSSSENLTKFRACLAAELALLDKRRAVLTAQIARLDDALDLLAMVGGFTKGELPDG